MGFCHSSKKKTDDNPTFDTKLVYDTQIRRFDIVLICLMLRL